MCHDEAKAAAIAPLPKPAWFRQIGVLRRIDADAAHAIFFVHRRPADGIGVRRAQIAG